MTPATQALPEVFHQRMMKISLQFLPLDRIRRVSETSTGESDKWDEDRGGGGWNNEVGIAEAFHSTFTIQVLNCG